MKFVKTAVAVAIVGIAAAPMIASADTTLSGVVQTKVQGTDADGDDPDIAAGDVRVGVVSEHELNNGMTGYGSVKLTVDDLLGEVGGVGGLTVPGNPTESGEGTTQAIDGTVKADDVYVGIKGGFGDIRLGEVPVALEYGQLANDIHDVSGDIGDGLSYTGTFGPASIVLNYSPEEDSDVLGVGAKFNFAGATIGVGFADQGSGADSDADSTTNLAVGASYAIAGVSLAAQYWTQEAEPDDNTSIAVKAGYGIGAVSGAVTFSTLETALLDNTVIRLDLKYDFGGGFDISTRIDNVSTDSNVAAVPDPEDLVAYRVMLTKSF